MGRFLRLPVVAILVLALVAALGGDAMAASVQTGTIKGKVFDEKGETLVGVTLSLRSPALVREQVRLTDADGVFFVSNLPTGKYVVTAQLSGYITISFDTEVVVDRTTSLPITMKEGEMTETVTVTATRPVVDKTATEKAEVYDKTFTNNLPAGRSYQSLLQFAPGVTGGSNPNILGGTSSSNSYLVDGVSVRDPGTGTFGQNINFDSVDFVEVKLTGVSAEYGEFQGGVSNVVTKAGGNDFTGSLRTVTNAPAWTLAFGPSSQGEFAAPVAGPATTNGLGFTYSRPTIAARGPNEKVNRISATVGGPVLVDRIWFFLGYDNNQNVQTGLLGSPIGGVNGDGLYGNFFDGEFPTLKMTWQVTNNHRLQYAFNEDPASTTRCYGQIFFGGPCWDSYVVDLQGQGGYSYSGTWNSTWSPTVTSDFKYTRFKNAFKIAPLTPIPTRTDLLFPSPGGLGAGLGMAPAIASGGSGEFDANIFDETPEDRNRTQYEAQGVWFLDTQGTGSHTIKVGADYKEQDRVGASIIQGNALLYFDAIPDLNDPASSNPDETNLNSIYNINNRAYYTFLDFSLPTQAGPINKFTALYFNDEWQLNDRLAFNLGLRFEKSDNRNDLNEEIISDTGFAPRLGLSWDLTGQGKHVVKTTASRYLAGVNLTTLAPFVRLAGGQSAYDIYTNTAYPAGGTPTWDLAAQVRPDPDTNQWLPGIEPQAIDEYTLGYEVQIAPTFGLGAKYVYRTWDNILTTNFAYDYSTGTARQLQTLGINSQAEREYNAAILTADKRFADNWELKASYVYSKTEGNVETENGGDPLLAYAGVPQLIDNRYGLLSFDVKHALKLQGNYDIPLKSARHAINLGGIFDFRSGNPYSRSRVLNVVVGPGEDGVQDVDLGSNSALAGGTDDQIGTNITQFFDPRGSSGREPNIWTLDLLAAYRLKFTRNFNFELRFEVFNVTNEQKTTAVSTNWWTDDDLSNPLITSQNPASATRQGRLRTNYTFGFPTAYSQFQTPRAYRVNAAITW